MLLVRRPGEVGRPLLFSQRMVGGAGARDPARTGTAGLLFAGLDLASAIGVGASLVVLGRSIRTDGGMVS